MLEKGSPAQPAGRTSVLAVSPTAAPFVTHPNGEAPSKQPRPSVRGAGEGPGRGLPRSVRRPDKPGCLPLAEIPRRRMTYVGTSPT